MFQKDLGVPSKDSYMRITEIAAVFYANTYIMLEYFKNFDWGVANLARNSTPSYLYKSVQKA